MKNKYYLYILPLCAIFLFNGKKYDESVIERIHLNVNICIEGEECGEVAPPQRAPAQNPTRNPQKNLETCLNSLGLRTAPCMHVGCSVFCSHVWNS